MVSQRAVRLSCSLAVLAAFLGLGVSAEAGVERIAPSRDTGAFQPYQNPVECARCHPRQYAENRQSVKSGYRNYSPTFNNLELAGNFAVQAVLEAGAIRNNLRPVYDGRNMSNADQTANNNEIRAGFCIGCHAGFGIGLGINPGAEVAPRDVPEWGGRLVQNPDGPPGQRVVEVNDASRPLRDYHFVDSNGNQVLPAEPGGLPPAGSHRTQMGDGINCDFCHNVVGPDPDRSFQGDGFGNATVQLLYSTIKVGPFKNAFPPLNNFHQSTFRDDRINYLRSPNLCNACHDVRVPAADIVVPESREHSPNVSHYRLENLSTEWAIGPYNDANAPENPFRQSVRCQDCHMSLYPYAGDTVYTVTDPTNGDQLQVSAPTPGVFPINFAAEGSRGIRNGDFGTQGNIPLPRRKVVTHYFTGIDVPLLYDSELNAFLGPEYPSPFIEGDDEYGIPLSLKERRKDLADASVRIDLDKSDQEAKLGEHFTARVRAVALTGHRLPAGFSQERGVWIQFTVSAKEQGSDNDVVLYQSGYLVDKAHPEVDETEPDGSVHDEDQEHIEAIVNPFTHDNEVFGLGPDDGPHARIFEGRKEGLVFFRNELVRIYGPATWQGQPTRISALNRVDPRTGETLNYVLEEETFSAGLTNFVDNWRSLPPLQPRTYSYEVNLPSAEELEELGVHIEGPLKVSAKVHFRHFPPLFLRFLARVGGAYVERNLYDSARLAPFVGLRGPANKFLNLWTEQRIDDLLRIMEDIASAEMEVPLDQGESASASSWNLRRGGSR